MYLILQHDHVKRNESQTILNILRQTQSEHGNEDGIMESGIFQGVNGSVIVDIISLELSIHVYRVELRNIVMPEQLPVKLQLYDITRVDHVARHHVQYLIMPIL